MKTVKLELPASLYADLQALALEEQMDMVEMLSQWVELARQSRSWLHGSKELAERFAREDVEWGLHGDE